MTDTEYVFEVIDNERDAYLCARLIAEEFCAHSSITVFDHITPNSFFDDCSWPLLSDVFDQRLSFLARHQSSGEIVAAIVAGDLFLAREKHPFDASRPAENIPLEDFIDEMDDIFIRRDFGQELKLNLVLHITVGATRAQHSGKCVASRLRQVMCAHARAVRGFQYALVQALNPATRHIYLNKMGGKEVTTVDPTTWLWKKKGDGLSCPYRNFTGRSISNILVTLTSELQ